MVVVMVFIFVICLTLNVSLLLFSMLLFFLPMQQITTLMKARVESIIIMFLFFWLKEESVLGGGDKGKILSMPTHKWKALLS